MIMTAGGYRSTKVFQMMVEIIVDMIRISDKGILLKMKEVSDSFHIYPYRWNEDK